MTQSYLRFARYVTSLPASAAMTSRRCSSNYGNSRLTRHGSTFAIRRVASSRPKTYHPPQPMHPPDVVDLLQGRWPGHFVCPEGRYVQGDADTGTERRAGIFIGPEFGAVFRPGLVAAAGERMNTDLHMSGDLTNIGKGNLFVIFGEPEIAIIPAPGQRCQGWPRQGQRAGRVPSQHRRNPQRPPRLHRLLVHRHRLQQGELQRLPQRASPTLWYGHYNANDASLAGGDLLLVDCAPGLHCYTSDYHPHVSCKKGSGGKSFAFSKTTSIPWYLTLFYRTTRGDGLRNVSRYDVS